METWIFFSRKLGNNMGLTSFPKTLLDNPSLCLPLFLSPLSLSLSLSLSPPPSLPPSLSLFLSLPLSLFIPLSLSLSISLSLSLSLYLCPCQSVYLSKHILVHMSLKLPCMTGWMKLMLRATPVCQLLLVYCCPHFNRFPAIIIYKLSSSSSSPPSSLSSSVLLSSSSSLL